MAGCVLAKGYKSTLGFRELTCTGFTPTAATDPAEFIPIDSFNFSRDQAVDQVTEMGLGQRTMKRMVYGDVTAAGSFTKSVDPDNGIGLYKYILGGSLTTASVTSGTNTHTFSEDDDVKDASGNVMRLYFQTSINGGSATTRNWYLGLPNTYSLNAATGGLAKETIGMSFREVGDILNTAPAVSITQTPPINYNKVTVSLGTSITTLSQVAAQDVTLNVSNNLLENRELGTATVDKFQYGQKKVDGSFTFVFENYDLFDSYAIGNSGLAMQIQLESTEETSGTNHYIRFKLPEVFISGGHPDVPDTGLITQQLNFVANYGSNAGYQIKIEVLNSQATVPI